MKKLFVFIINILIIFLIDALLCLALIKLDFGQLRSRLFSIVIAFLLTWQPNRLLVFAKLRHRSAVETFRYGIVGLFSALLNYMIYAKLFAVFPNLQPLMLILLSAVPSMLFVILLYVRFMLKRYPTIGK
ncbi:MAG: hypothetical protein C4617_01020 [Candidatus Liberibacter europaeus]|uniref:GtrA/DPMS transmembrane domain-containing protein n=1 Tax=Candidatus Liberibacter europaeus TaxID=744859 RepID=A0A2T4VZ13_9HYPH|nr:hypothetical protein [Candidatus Liberibacter europaeus]PTL87016.1 MAG: hypothetical protein C4617_01020 [Candidatus Liberibacter europaeus]